MLNGESCVNNPVNSISMQSDRNLSVPSQTGTNTHPSIHAVLRRSVYTIRFYLIRLYPLLSVEADSVVVPFRKPCLQAANQGDVVHGKRLCSRSPSKRQIEKTH